MDEDDGPLLDMDREGGDANEVMTTDRIDEQLLLQSGFHKRKVWLVKVPKFLQERWATVTEADLHLATMRVYDIPPGSTQAPRITLILPQNPRYKTDDLPAEFDLHMAPGAEREGQVKKEGFILSEKKPIDGRIYPTLFSRVHHEASLQPVYSREYSTIVKKRGEVAEKPKRTLKRLNEEELGAGKVAQMASGVGGGFKGKFGGFKTSPAGPQDRAIRLPRNELMDLLFSFFEEHPYWSFKALKDKTRQPDVYLKEVLTEVAKLIRRGPYTGLWCLLEVYKKTDGAERGEGGVIIKSEEGVEMVKGKVMGSDGNDSEDEMIEVEGGT